MVPDSYLVSEFSTRSSIAAPARRHCRVVLLCCFSINALLSVNFPHWSTVGEATPSSLLFITAPELTQRPRRHPLPARQRTEVSTGEERPRCVVSTNLSSDLLLENRAHVGEDGRSSCVTATPPSRWIPADSGGGSSPSDGGFVSWLEHRSGSAEAKSNDKPDKEKKGGGGGTPPTPKDSKPRKSAVPKASAAGHGTPRTADKSPSSGSADRKAPMPKAAASRLATTPEKGKPTKPPQEQQAQLATIREELMNAKEQLVENEKEKCKVLAELERAKKVADEANTKLQDVLDVQRRAIEVQEADKLPARESEQASIHGQQEADDAVLRSTVEQLEKARYELVDAIDAKNEALS
uniref:Uncharacterized protein n=1 Tax=Zea mays TaxID=4577 RepID=A0A804LQG2_MAIZE